MTNLILMDNLWITLGRLDFYAAYLVLNIGVLNKIELIQNSCTVIILLQKRSSQHLLHSRAGADLAGRCCGQVQSQHPKWPPGTRTDRTSGQRDQRPIGHCEWRPNGHMRGKLGAPKTGEPKRELLAATFERSGLVGEVPEFYRQCLQGQREREGEKGGKMTSASTLPRLCFHLIFPN